MLDKIKDIIEDIKNEIEWILAGCPKPAKVPVKSKDKEDRDETSRNSRSR